RHELVHTAAPARIQRHPGTALAQDLVVDIHASYVRAGHRSASSGPRAVRPWCSGPAYWGARWHVNRPGARGPPPAQRRHRNPNAWGEPLAHSTHSLALSAIGIRQRAEALEGVVEVLAVDQLGDVDGLGDLALAREPVLHLGDDRGVEVAV